MSSPCSPRDSQESSPPLQFESTNSSALSLLYCLHSYRYMTNGETTALTVWAFVCKEMSLLFNILSRFVIAFLPRGERLLISRLQSLSTVLLEPKEIKSLTVSIVSHLFAMK